MAAILFTSWRQSAITKIQIDYGANVQACRQKGWKNICAHRNVLILFVKYEPCNLTITQHENRCSALIHYNISMMKSCTKSKRAPYYRVFFPIAFYTITLFSGNWSKTEIPSIYKSKVIIFRKFYSYFDTNKATTTWLQSKKNFVLCSQPSVDLNKWKWGCQVPTNLTIQDVELDAR